MSETITTMARGLHDATGCDCGEIAPCDGLNYGHDYLADAEGALSESRLPSVEEVARAMFISDYFGNDELAARAWDAPSNGSVKGHWLRVAGDVLALVESRLCLWGGKQ